VSRGMEPPRASPPRDATPAPAPRPSHGWPRDARRRVREWVQEGRREDRGAIEMSVSYTLLGIWGALLADESWWGWWVLGYTAQGLLLGWFLLRSRRRERRRREKGRLQWPRPDGAAPEHDP
jgi:hypothetical protein